MLYLNRLESDNLHPAVLTITALYSSDFSKMATERLQEVIHPIEKAHQRESFQ